MASEAAEQLKQPEADRDGASPETDFEGADIAPRESPLRALIHIVLIGGLMAGGLYLYMQKVEKDKELNDLQVKARAHMKLDSVYGYTESLKFLEQARALDPQNPLTIATMAVAEARLWGGFGMQEHKAKAQQLAQEADGTGAPISERYAATGLTTFYDGKAQQAHDQLDKIIKEVGAPPQIAGVMAEIQLALGKEDEALGSFQRAHDLEWDYPAWARGIARVYMRRDSWGNARNFLRKALNIQDQHIPSKLDLAIVELHDGNDVNKQTKEIKGLLDEGTLPPRLKAHASFAMAWSAFARREYDEVYKWLGEAEQTEKDVPEYFSLRGQALDRQGKHGEAATAFARAIELDPKVPRYHFSLSRAQLAAGNKDGALQTLENYKKHLPETSGFNLAAAKVYVEMNDFEKADAAIEAASKDEGWNAEVFYTKGLMLQKQSKFEDSAKAYEEAIAIQEIYPEVYHQVCRMFVEQKAVEDGLSQCSTAAQQYLQTGAPRATIAAIYTEMADMLNKLRKKPEADELLEKAKAILAE